MFTKTPVPKIPFLCKITLISPPAPFFLLEGHVKTNTGDPSLARSEMMMKTANKVMEGCEGYRLASQGGKEEGL